VRYGAGNAVLVGKESNQPKDPYLPESEMRQLVADLTSDCNNGQLDQARAPKIHQTIQRRAGDHGTGIPGREGLRHSRVFRSAARVSEKFIKVG